MLIRAGFDIRFTTTVPVPVLALLSVRPELHPDLRTPDTLVTEPAVPMHQFIDPFGNTCTRLTLPPGETALKSDFIIENSGAFDDYAPEAEQHAIEDLPDDVLGYLLPSRYCEVSQLVDEAWEIAGSATTGWARVQALVDAAHERIHFDYMKASSERTARGAWDEGFGVCRDFAHLALTLCRAINIPARYCTGYLGDLGMDPIDAPMDFSAWFEVYIGGRWYTFDARHNQRRMGRLPMARGRDAADTALTTSFGSAPLTRFDIHSDEVATVDLSRPPAETALPQRYRAPV